MKVCVSIIIFCWIGFIGHFYFFDDRLIPNRPKSSKSSRLGLRMVSAKNSRFFPVYRGRLLGEDSVCLFVKDGEIFGTIVCAVLLMAILIIGWIVRPATGMLEMISGISVMVVVIVSCIMERVIIGKASDINETWKNGCYGEGSMEKHSRKALRAVRKTYPTAELVKTSDESFFEKIEVWYIVIQTEDGQTTKRRVCDRLDYRYAEHPSIRLL